MDNITWYTDLAKDPSTIRANFLPQVSHLNPLEFVIDLIELFGSNPNVSRLLTKDLSEYYVQKLGDLEELQKMYLTDLLHGNSPPYKEISEKGWYEHIHAISSMSLIDCVISDMKLGITSTFPMPIQKARALGCYSITPRSSDFGRAKELKDYISHYNEELQKILTGIFDLTRERENSANQVDTYKYHLSLKHESLLFKHFAIESHSYLELLYTWLIERNKPKCPLLIWFEQHSGFYQLFLKKDNDQKPSSPTKLSFQAFIVQKTIRNLFHSKDSSLHLAKSTEKNLVQEFLPLPGEEVLKKENDRQTVSFFIQDLIRLQKAAEENKKHFPIHEALTTLDRQDLKKDSFLYNFLHALAHYFHILSFTTTTDKLGRYFLLFCIHSIPFNERKKFDPLINEQYRPKPFKIDEQDSKRFFEQKGCHKFWGVVFLRLMINHNDLESPFLSLNDHLEVVLMINKLLPKKLPSRIIEDLLFYQTMRPSIVDIINEFKALSDQISPVEQDNPIHETIFSGWDRLHKECMEAIDPVYPLIKQNVSIIGREVSKEKMLKHIEELAYLLQFMDLDFMVAAQKLPLMTKPRTVNPLEFNWWRKSSEPSFFRDFVKAYILYMYALPLERSLHILDGLITDKSSKEYNLLHAIFHYKNASNAISISQSEEAKLFFFNAIYAISLEERQKLGKPIGGIYPLKERLEIDADFLYFAYHHPLSLSAWGKIFLRCAQSPMPPNKKSPYLSVKEHFKLFDKIEFILGTTLLPSIYEGLLYYLMTYKQMTHVVDGFLVMHDKFLKDSSYWYPLSKEDDSMLTGLVAQIPLGINSTLQEENGLLDLFLSNHRSKSFQAEVMEPLASILSHGTAPLAHFSFKESMEEIEKGSKPFLSFSPLHPLLPFGPAWITCWEEISGDYTFVAVMTNPSKDDATCLFRIPLPVPQNLEKRALYFKFLSSAVDELGKELPSDPVPEEKKALARSDDIFSGFLKLERESEELLWRSSPSITEKWRNFFNEDDEIKYYENDLFNFIKSLRKTFLLSYFHLLNPEKRTLPKDSGIEVKFSFFEHAAQMHSLANCQKVYLQKNYNSSQLSKIYKAISAARKLLDEKISMPLELVFQYSVTRPVTHKMTFDWWQEKDTEYIQLKLKNDALMPVKLTMKYPAFNEEKKFIDLLLMQAFFSLFCDLTVPA